MIVLVVDPEPRVPEALALVFSDLEPSWEVLSAGSNREAFRRLEERPCDAVLTELRADGIDAGTLLSRLAQEQPRAARLVLSGRHDHDAPFELLHVAHQLLPKPCAAETLHRILSRLRELTQLLPDTELQTLASKAAILPSIPERTPTIEPRFQTDSAYAAKLMQLASSGFVCGSSKVADIDGALQQLGAHWSRRLAQALSEQGNAEGALAKADALLRARKRSVRIARIAASLAPHPEDATTAYVAGLLCDVGHLLLEPEQRGETHAELGAYLLGLWGLPFQIVEAVAHHHAPARARADCVGLTQLVWLAACLVDGEAPSPDVLAQLGVESLYLQAQQRLSALVLEEQRGRD